MSSVISSASTLMGQINDSGKIQNKEQKDLKNFYNFDSDTPMKFRVFLFRQQFKEFSTLKLDQIMKLIGLYDKNLDKAHERSSQ